MDGIINDLCGDRWHGALLRLWLSLSTRQPAFAEAEKVALGDVAEHQRVSAAFMCALLDEPRPIRRRNSLHNLPVRHHMVMANPVPVRIDTGEEAWLIRRRHLQRHRHARHATQTGHLYAWLRYHWIYPETAAGLAVVSRPTTHAATRRLAVALDRGSVKVTVHEFVDGVRPDWRKSGTSRWAAGLTDHARRRQSLRDALASAASSGADILVLPELTITTDLRDEVCEWLADSHDLPFALVLPGSFHEVVDGRQRNRALLLDPTGQPLLEHLKLCRWGDMNDHEGVDGGDRIELLDSPVGVVAIPICRDFCDEGEPWSMLWSRLGVEWALVPGFGGKSSLSAHQKQAGHIHRAHAAVTVLANQHPEGADAAPGFVKHTDKSADATVAGVLLIEVSLR